MSYEKFRAKILALSVVVIDPDEIVEITPGWKLKRWEFEALRKIALENLKR